MSNPLYYPNRDMLASGFPTNWTLLKRLMWVRIMQGGSIPPEYETVTGNPVSFETVRPYKLRQLSVAFAPVQEGSGDPSPDNVRPISGWDSLNVEQTGVNVWDEEWENGYWSRTTGAKYGSDSTYLRCADYIPCLPNTGYYFKSPAVHASSTNYASVMFYDSNKGYISYSFVAQNPSFTTPANAAYMTFYVEIGTTGSTYKNDISINYPATDHDYHAYNGRTISITIGQTVYSGTVDVLTGVVTVTHKGVDMGTRNWVYMNAGKFRCNDIGEITDYAPNPDTVPNIYCSAYKLITARQIYYKTANGIGQSAIGWGSPREVFVIDESITVTTGEEFKELMSGVQLVYELKTPQTIQLTPQQVSSLLGENNMWSDANGDLTVEYRSN